MESKDYNIVKQEVEHVLAVLNSQQILTLQDEVEIEDHFFCNVEDLQSQGLNTREALLIARSRFGALDGIREDYEVVRPENSWLQYAFVAILGFSFLKMSINFIDLISETFWVSKLYFGFGGDFLYLDLPIRLLLFGFIFSFAWKYIKKKGALDINKLWYVPILYLISELVSRLASFIVFPGINQDILSDNVQYIGQIWYTHAIFSIVIMIAVTIFASYKLYKMKKEDLQYV